MESLVNIMSRIIMIASVKEDYWINLADAIVRMKEHPLASSDCRKRAEEKFDKDKCFEKYIQFYEKLV